MSERASKRVTGASERANGWASGLVLTSGFPVILSVNPLVHASIPLSLPPSILPSTFLTPRPSILPSISLFLLAVGYYAPIGSFRGHRHISGCPTWLDYLLASFRSLFFFRLLFLADVNHLRYLLTFILVVFTTIPFFFTIFLHSSSF